MLKICQKQGTSAGHSTTGCAEAISENSGKTITIEQNPDKIKIAKDNFRKAETTDSIIIEEGAAINILKN